jgi:cell division protein ZapA (FtsZ GTPase activity inhibitor)
MMQYNSLNKLRALTTRVDLRLDHWVEGVSVTVATALSAMTAIMLSYLLLMAQGWL